MEMTIADILRAAADKIRQEGWRQHGAGLETGANCAWGAIHYLCTWEKKGTEKKAVAVMKASIGLGNRDGLNPLFDWNDSPRRTKREVIAALLIAADLAEQVTP